MAPLVRTFAFAGLLSLLGGHVAAQCTNVWLPGYGYPGVLGGGVGAATLWDSDGSGPQPIQVVVGGLFSLAGTVAAGGLAAWDPATGQWSPLPPALLPRVTALAVLPNNQLVVAADDWPPATTLTARIAVWNGTAWSQLGPDFDQPVAALHVRPNGELVAGGSFTPSSGPSLGGLVRWNGTAWTPVGSGVQGTVNALASLPGGDLVAGGVFSSAGGVAVGNLARWNGTAWSAMGAGTGQPVWALASMPSGRLFAGGGVGLLEWNGASWTTVAGLSGSPYPSPAILCLAASGANQLVVGGQITAAGGQPTNAIAELDAATGTWSTWGAGLTTYGNAAPPSTLLPLPGGGVLAGGWLRKAGSVDVGGIAVWTGSSWLALSDGPLVVACVAPVDDTTFVVGGSFRNLGNLAADRVARWTGTAWVSMGSGVDNDVLDLVRMPNGDIVAAGAFQNAGAVQARGLARWDGVAWSEFAGGVAGGAGVGVRSLRLLANGDLVAGGSFQSAGGVPANNIAVWNGSVWAPMGAGLAGGVTAIADGGGVGVVALTGSGVLTQWDGSAWTARWTYAHPDYPGLLATMPGGLLVVAGYTSLFYGSSYRGFVDVIGPGWYQPWSTVLGSHNSVMGLVPLPDGSLLVSGGFQTIGGIVTTGAARLSPSLSWTSAPAGSGATAGAPFPNGDLLLAGYFANASSSVSSVGRLTTTCPATAASGGNGCIGSGGANVLTATSLPWLGGTFASRATGMPAIGLALGVLGLTTASVPLAAILPQGGAGCSLLVSPDLPTAYLPSGGAFATQTAIPNALSLVGAVFHQQVVAIELSGAGAITTLTSTNRLTLTVGAF